MYKSTVFARWPFATNFSDVWLTVQNSSSLAGGPWAIISQSQPSSKRWREVNSDNWSTPPWLLRAPQGHTLPAWPACLSVAGDLSQSYLCLSLHPHHLLCWQCSLTPIFKCAVCIYACGPRSLLMFLSISDTSITFDKLSDNHQLNRQITAWCLLCQLK